MPRRETKFYAGEYYHLYNRGNSQQKIFFERENYLFFLRRMRKYLTDYVVIVCYCLMQNHFHLIIGVKSPPTSQTSEVSKTSEVAEAPQNSEVAKNSEVSESISKAMMRLSVSYTKAINKRYQRSGALFQGNFQALHVDKKEYLLHLSRYIHLNPVEVGLVERPESWEFSSYREYIGSRNGTLPGIITVPNTKCISRICGIL